MSNSSTTLSLNLYQRPRAPPLKGKRALEKHVMDLGQFTVVNQTFLHSLKKNKAMVKNAIMLPSIWDSLRL